MAAFVLPAIGSGAGWYERGTDNLRNGAYFQASKALAQAIQIDSRYALARARLAQAWIELDYYDRAKDELLAATTIAGDRSSVSPRDALYLDAISAIVRRDFKEALNAYTQIAQLTPDDSQVYVDLGYAYENDEAGQGAGKLLKSDSVEQRSIRDRLSTRGDRLSP